MDKILAPIDIKYFNFLQNGRCICRYLKMMGLPLSLSKCSPDKHLDNPSCQGTNALCTCADSCLTCTAHDFSDNVGYNYSACAYDMCFFHRCKCYMTRGRYCNVAAFHECICKLCGPDKCNSLVHGVQLCKSIDRPLGCKTPMVSRANTCTNQYCFYHFTAAYRNRNFNNDAPTFYCDLYVKLGFPELPNEIIGIVLHYENRYDFVLYEKK
jgi:hypothetical protein